MKKAWVSVACLALVVGSCGCVTTRTPPLLDAAGKGDVQTVRVLLDGGANVNEWYYGTPLSFAAYEGHLPVVKLLLERGADVNIRSQGGDTALGAAAQMAHVEIAKILVDRGADIDMAVAGLEQRAAECASLTTASTDDFTRAALVKAVARFKSGVRLLERLQREHFPETQRVQLVSGAPHHGPSTANTEAGKAAEGSQHAAQKLLDAKKLLDAGVITQEEFDALKARHLPAVLER